MEKYGKLSLNYPNDLTLSGALSLNRILTYLELCNEYLYFLKYSLRLLHAWMVAHLYYQTLLGFLKYEKFNVYC